MKRLAACFAVTLGLLVVDHARASPTFPGVMEQELKLAGTPECTTCHAAPAGGFGTATLPFAVYLRSRGLRAADPASLRNALLAAEGEQSDVDDDGVTDIEELKDGDNPNSASAATTPPAYGCSMQEAPATAGWRDWALIALLVLLASAAALRRSKPAG